MALSKNPGPIEPAHPRYAHGQTAAISRVYRVAASQTIVRGDLIIISANKAAKAVEADDFNIVGSDTAGLLGIAMGDVTTGASVAESDKLIVANAYANVFSANLLTNDTTDVTVSDYTNQLLFRPVNVVTINTKAVWYVASVAAVNNNAGVIDMVRKGGDAPGDSTVNPRMFFGFRRALLWNGLY